MANPDTRPGRLDRILAAIPRIMSSKVSIFIFIFLFCCLVVYSLRCMVIPALNPFEPGDDAQLVLGNYTNVLSALGASIAAGSGVAIHNKVKNLNKSTGEFHDYFDEKHRKMQESFDTQQQKMQELLDRLYEMQKNKVELKNK